MGDLFDQAAHDPGGKVRIAVPANVVSSARFSPCGRYRYELRRTWDASLPACMFLMMNPSTADVRVDDPTVAKCRRFAMSWGYGALLVGNVCAYRATDKRDLLKVDDPVGIAENRAALLHMAGEAAVVVAAWGRLPGQLNARAWEIADCMREAGNRLHALRTSADGNPHHPLYLPGRLRPEPWRGWTPC